jgi:hypothetical protein
MPHKITCSYCDRPAELVTGRTIYPHRPDLFHQRFYRCEPCGAYVGCHRGTVQPLGRLANAELRRAKIAAHAAFDPIWRSGRSSRSDAYAWLAKQLGIAIQNCHIGMFDVEQCRRVVEVCEQRAATWKVAS